MCPFYLILLEAHSNLSLLALPLVVQGLIPQADVHSVILEPIRLDQVNGYYCGQSVHLS